MRHAVLATSVALLAACATVPSSPPHQGTYRALGTEPFWSLEIGASEMRFTTPETQNTPLVQPTPRPIIGIAGEIYQTPRINVNIVHARCSDGMSDRIYPDKVQVRVDGRAYEGCGGEPIMPASLSGTSWSVVAVNGRAVPGGERYYLRFEGERMSGRFGCNSMAGGYQLSGNTLTAGPLAITRMACPDMRDETEAARILSQPVVLRRSDGERLILSNAAGSITLRRSI